MEARPVLIFDRDLRVKAASAACSPLLGVSEQKLVGLQCKEALGCPSCLGEACPLREALAGEQAEGLLPTVRSGVPLGVTSAPILTGEPDGPQVIMHLRSPEPGEAAMGSGIQTMLDDLRHKMGSDLAALAFFDETRREIRWQVTSGSLSGALGRVRLKPGQGFAGRIIMTELPLHTFRFPDDLNKSPGAYPFLQAEGLKAAIGVPLMAGSRALGMLMVGSRKLRLYTDEDLVFLTEVAGPLTLAAEVLCLYGDALRSERAKLAEEVHDGLSQNLFGLKLLLYQVQQDIPRSTPEQLNRGMGEVCTMLDGTLKEVRRLIAELRGGTQIPSGLLGALSDYLSHFYRLSHLQVELAISLPPGEEIIRADVHDLLRILQEALMNVQRHAHATRVRVEVAREGEFYRLTIADDGRGFDPDEVPAEGHFGLSIMRDRAARLRGDLRITAAPGRGTSVTLRIPV